jgi:hypothetical protein
VVNTAAASPDSDLMRLSMALPASLSSVPPSQRAKRHRRVGGTPDVGTARRTPWHRRRRGPRFGWARRFQELQVASPHHGRPEGVAEAG